MLKLRKRNPAVDPVQAQENVIAVLKKGNRKHKVYNNKKGFWKKLLQAIIGGGQ